MFNNYGFVVEDKCFLKPKYVKFLIVTDTMASLMRVVLSRFSSTGTT